MYQVRDLYLYAAAGHSFQHRRGRPMHPPRSGRLRSRRRSGIAQSRFSPRADGRETFTASPTRPLCCGLPSTSADSPTERRPLCPDLRHGRPSPLQPLSAGPTAANRLDRKFGWQPRGNSTQTNWIAAPATARP